jgi:hypothetical protein
MSNLRCQADAKPMNLASAAKNKNETRTAERDGV